MKPDRNGTMTVESTLVSSKDVRMGIDQDSLEHLVNVLTDLYSDPEAAVIREYSTNALDSHVEAGVKEPIQVELPGPLKPTLTIRDFGTGLSVDEIENVYASYGRSTKRESNDAVGMLGLGCKSALTYSDQFSLVSVKDGRKLTVAITRDEKGVGVMQILSDEATTDRNGVEVVIPARRENRLESKANDFFAHWAPGTVLVNGHDPEPVEGYDITDDILVTQNRTRRGDRSDYIVMGNVPYPTDLGIFDRHDPRSIVARVDIGEVHFAPSREALQDTAKTRATLKRIKDDFTREAVKAAQAKIETAGTRWEAVAALKEARDTLPSGIRGSLDATWQGEAIPESVSYPEAQGPVYYADPSDRYRGVRKPKEPRILEVPGRNPSYRYGNMHHKVADVTVDEKLTRAVWVTNYTNDKWTKQQREKLIAYHAEQTGTPRENLDVTNFYLVDIATLPMQEWLGPHRYDWYDIRKWKPAGTAAVAVRRGEYNAWDPNKKTYDSVGGHNSALFADEIDDKLPIYFVRASPHTHSSDWENLTAALGKVYLILLPSPRIEKFKRMFPSAKELRDGLNDIVTAKVKALSNEEKAACAWEGTTYHSTLLSLDPGKVDDPDLLKLITACKARKRASKTRATVEDILYNARDKGLYGAPVQVLPDEEVQERYPLLPEYGYTSQVRDHIHFYVNAAFAAYTKGNK